MPIHRLLLVLVCAVTVLGGARHVAAVDPDVPIALLGGRLVTQADQGNVTGDLVIENGKIVAVGAGITIPENAQRIDVSGLTVTPGLIDARSTLWLTTAAAREAANDGRLNVLDGIDPLAEDWQEVSRQGITSVYVQPRGNLGGGGAVLAVAPSDSVDGLVIRAPPGAQAAVGIASSSTTSRARYTEYDRIKKALEAAKKYGEQKKAYEEYLAKQKKSKDGKAKKADTKKVDTKKDDTKKVDTKKDDTKKDDAKKDDDKKKVESQGDKEKKPSTSATSSATASKPPTKPTPDPAKDFLLKVLARELPLRIEAHREDDVANALKLADAFKVRIVLEGVSYPQEQLKELAERRTNLVLGPVIPLESSPSYRRGRPEDWLTALTDDGVRWALATFGEQPRTSRLLRVQAAAAVAAGVEPERVLRAITSDAAAILGVGQMLGTLAAGQRADVVVFAGDPLDPATPVRLTMSRGKIVYQAITAAPTTTATTTTAAAPVAQLPGTLPPTYAITSSRILRKGKWRPGRIVVRQGKIASLSPTAELPEDVPIYDLGEAPVTPGLFVAHANLAAASIDDQSEADASNIQAGDAYDPSDARVDELVADGFLRLAFSPGSTNVVAGAACLVRLGAVDAVQSDNCAMKFVLSSNGRNANRYPASLAGQVELIQAVLRNQGEPSALFVPTAIQRELQTQRARRIKSVLNQQSTALFEANSPTEIRAAIRLVEQFDLRGALLNPEDVAPFIEDLKRAEMGVIARPVRASDYDRYIDGLVQASSAGVVIAFGATANDDGRTTAALAINAGMSPEAALAGLTTGGAKLLGMPTNTSELLAGGPADLVIWNGSPLNLGCRPTCVIVDGGRAVAKTGSDHGPSGQPAGTAPVDQVARQERPLEQDLGEEDGPIAASPVNN